MHINDLEGKLNKQDKNMCICQNCNVIYEIDLLVQDELWEKIKPTGKPEGAGLLCPVCITKKVASIALTSIKKRDSNPGVSALKLEIKYFCHST